MPNTGTQMIIRRFVLFVMMVHALPLLSTGQEKKTIPNGSDGLSLTVLPNDSASKKLPPNEFNGSYSTFKIGVGYIHDAVTYSKSKEFNQQLDSAGLEMDPMIKVRDFRVLGSGAFKTKRPFSFKFAFMYDGATEAWMVRETGITIGVKELYGNIFIGRTKEGYSMVKVMNGHSPWAAERQMALDVVPILADGIKWFGSLPKSRVFWNLGYYNDVLSEGQGFSTFKWQVDARIGWLPFYDKASEKVLHIATNLRHGAPLGGKITLKSRPESNPSPFIINTGSFAADKSTSIGGEIYYSTGRLLLGSEVMVHKFNGDGLENHSFSGGDVLATYLLTKTKRPYNTTASIFGFVKTNSSVFKGGWGEWEAVLKFSTLNLNDNEIQGGKFWRITPMINWYMTRNLRSEFVYGYGIWDRYHLQGAVHFFQYRIQLTVL
jgi:phosphate-selective porin OprO and OprP